MSKNFFKIQKSNLSNCFTKDYLLKIIISSLFIFSTNSFALAEPKSVEFLNETKLAKSFTDDFQIGLSYLDKGENEQAIVYLSRFIKTNSQNASAYYNRGIAYLNLKKYETAIGDFSTAIDLDENYSNAYINRGLAYYLLENHELAIKNYTKAIQLNPEAAIAYNNRGWAYKALGKVELSNADFAKNKELVEKNKTPAPIPTPNPTPIPRKDDVPNVSNTDPNAVKWTPVVEMNNQIFPSFFLATATQPVIESTVSGVIGDAQGKIGMYFVNSVPNTKIKLAIEIDSILKYQEFEATLSEQNKFYQIYPKLVWNWDALKRQKKATPANATFTLFINGKMVEKKTLVVRIRSINEAVYAYSYQLDENRWANTSSLFAAYVNEDHEWIDQILKEALQSKLVDSFIGYQGKPEQVINQVFAIWYVLQKRGFKYSSITNTSGSGTTDKVFSQYVRLFEESINASQANCVDGTVLIASILKKIGIKVGLILIPGHCFLVFDATGNGDWRGVETTMMGNVDFDKFPDTESKIKASVQGFLDAVASGNKTFAESLVKINEGNPQYKFVDVDKARKSGIFPIAW